MPILGNRSLIYTNIIKNYLNYKTDDNQGQNQFYHICKDFTLFETGYSETRFSLSG